MKKDDIRVTIAGAYFEGLFLSDAERIEIIARAVFDLFEDCADGDCVPPRLYCLGPADEAE